jgi:hypothetical protein
MTPIVKCKAVYTLTQNYQSVNFFFPDELKRRLDAAELFLTGIELQSTFSQL